MQIPYGMLPPWMMGMMVQGPESQQAHVSDIAVPARVNKALEFLHHLASKRRKMPAATEHQMEVVDQDKLCAEEEATRDAALQLLTKYFDGGLNNDQWEQLRFKALEKRADMGLREGRIIGCVGCHPMRPDPNCILCGGSGKIFVQAAGGPVGGMMPATKPDEEEEEDDDDDE